MAAMPSVAEMIMKRLGAGDRQASPPPPPLSSPHWCYSAESIAAMGRSYTRIERLS